jgi:hypothetical protein
VATPSTSALLAASVSVPDHVVYREFPAETVFLNLETGLYHGLNPTAGRMLAALEGSATVAEALEVLIAELGKLGEPAERIEADLVGLLLGLEQRGLVVIESR